MSAIEEGSARRVNANRLSFLVVEDQEFQRNMLVRMLKHLGASTIHTAADGREALELLKGLPQPVDVIISDLDMPGMDGMEFIRHIGDHAPGTSLIVASAVERGVLASVETMAAAYGISFLGSIEKPVTPRKLEELLHVQTVTRGVHEPPHAYGAGFTRQEIVDGLRAGEFEPFFQPKVRIATGEVVGAEALARWRHPRHGIVSPHAFVKTLEDAGDITALTRTILRQAASFCRKVHHAGGRCGVAVNLSIRCLTDLKTADEITEIVREQGLEPRHVVLEITESAATTDVGKVLENLARLRIKGFELSIDDYGTGYSSLEQLTRIPFTELKIDQSFVTHAGRYESARVILASSLEMSRKLKLRAVAEGVETSANWNLLVDLGCDIAQGHYIARPMSAEAYLEWLGAWPRMQNG